VLVNRGVLDGVFPALKLCHFFEIYFVAGDGKHTPGAKPGKIRVS
jgi:hypothetical protein